MQISISGHTIAFLLVIYTVMFGCTNLSDSAQIKTQIDKVTVKSLADVSEIVDPANMQWPRVIQAMNGIVSIPAKPSRIINASVGHAEITYSLVPANRVVGVGSATKDHVYSNVSELARKAPIISTDPEVILAAGPDVIVTSPFLKSETVAALTKAGVPVVQTVLSTNIDGQINTILLMGYIYGEEDRAITLALEVRSRHAALQQIVSKKPQESRSNVLSLSYYGDSIYTAGKNSTEGSIIESAGGINVAAENGLEWNPTISIESIISMNPDVIIIPQPAYSQYGNGEDFKARLINTPALRTVNAIKNKKITLVDPKFFTTVSFWNIRGAEILSEILWPEEMADKVFPHFSTPE
jgi:iron complex transport system substrate-binding protein